MTHRSKIVLKLSIILALIAAAFCWPVLAHYLAKNKSERYCASLKAAGEKMTIGELVPRLSTDDLNAAMALMTDAGRLPTISSNFPPLMKYISPGKAQVGWQQEILPNTEVSNVWAGLKGPLEVNADALADMRAILQHNTPAYNLNYEQGFSLLLPHLARLKTIAQWFSADAIYELHLAGDDITSRHATNALENLTAIAALGGMTDREPLLISELVRVAINAIGMATAWEVLQCPGLREAELSDMQRTWEKIDFLSQAESALSMERCMFVKAIADGRKSYSAIANISFSSTPASTTALGELTQLSKDVLENPKEGLITMAHRYPGYWRWKWWQSYDDEIATIETAQASLEAIRRAKKGQAIGQVIKELEKTTNQVHDRHPVSGRWLGVSPSSPTLSFINRIARIEMERTLLVTAIALRRYQLAHGSFPQRLNEIVPQFVASVPIDPMDGQPLRYRPGTNGLYALYSVGDDGQDNGGDGTPLNAGTKQWMRGRDAVWPQPASKAELDAYTAEEKKKGTLRDEFRRRYGLDAAPPPAGTNRL